MGDREILTQGLSFDLDLYRNAWPPNQKWLLNDSSSTSDGLMAMKQWYNTLKAKPGMIKT